MKLVICIAVVVLLAAGAFFYLNQPANLVVQNNTATSLPIATMSSEASQIAADLKQGGSSYADPNGIYNFLYPSDYQFDSVNESQIRIYKNGPSQQGQTEMYDGVLILFEPIQLSGKTLSQWLDDKIAQSTADGTIKITQPKQPTTINNYPGFSYSLEGLGEAKYLAMQKDANSENAVEITMLVLDPTSVGFQAEVDAILSTLQLLK